MDGLKARIGMCPLPPGPSGLTFVPELRIPGTGVMVEGQLSCAPPVCRHFFMATDDARGFGARGPTTLMSRQSLLEKTQAYQGSTGEFYR